MNDVFQAAAQLQAVCQQQGWQFCFIGGLAVLRWGEPRETADADLTLLTGFGGEERYIQTLLQHFTPRRPDVEAFALQNRVLLLRTSGGIDLDVSLAALPYEELVVARSSTFVYPPGISLQTCSAEDLVVLKTFAARGQDWVDVERVMVRQSGNLDWPYIRSQLRPLAELKEEPELVEQLERLRSECEK